MPERRKLDRREFSYYMRVLNEHTGELIGHLADISTGGFRLESRSPLKPNLEILMRMDLTNEVSDKDHLVFVAKSKWCRHHRIDPLLYNIGFQIVEMAPEDLDVFIRIFEKYGAVKNSKDRNSIDYLWGS